MFITFKFCIELEILLPKTTSQFGFQFTSAIYSQKLHSDSMLNVYWIWSGGLIDQLTCYVERSNIYPHYPWEKCEKTKNRRS